MEPDEIDHAVTSAEHYVDTQMAPADLVSIVSLGSSLLVNQDFTTDRALLKKQLDQFSSGSGQGFEEGTTGTTEGRPTQVSHSTADDTEYNISIPIGGWKLCARWRRSSPTFSRRNR